MMKVCLALLALVTITCSVSAVIKKQPHKKVLILGAGVSGITAAKTLLDNGVDDFLVLEGQKHIGGRVQQKYVSGYSIAVGPSWIHFAHDEETAPIWNLKNETNLKGIISDYSDIIIRNERGENITDMKSFHKLEHILENVEEAQDKRLAAKKPPISARVGLALMGWKPKTAAQRLIEYFEIDFEMGKSADLAPFSDLFVKEPDFFITDSRGTCQLFEVVYKKFLDKIKLGRTVTQVRYNSSFVQVTTSGGEVYTADYALCTFSTGVLGSDMVKFYPPFPAWKTEAILKMPMSAYNKIFLRFPRKFWDNNEYILLGSSKRTGYYPIAQDLERPGMYPAGSGMMLMTTTGDEARRIERQSFEKTKAEIVERLRGVYGEDVPEPTGIYYPRWTLNPYIRGAYSDAAIGMTSRDFKYLNQNLGSLYFSGEAISEDWYGYMQGAELTGKEKASVIAKRLKSKKR